MAIHDDSPDALREEQDQAQRHVEEWLTQAVSQAMREASQVPRLRTMDAAVLRDDAPLMNTAEDTVISFHVVPPLVPEQMPSDVPGHNLASMPMQALPDRVIHIPVSQQAYDYLTGIPQHIVERLIDRIRQITQVSELSNYVRLYNESMNTTPWERAGLDREEWEFERRNVLEEMAVQLRRYEEQQVMNRLYDVASTRAYELGNAEYEERLAQQTREITYGVRVGSEVRQHTMYVLPDDDNHIGVYPGYEVKEDFIAFNAFRRKAEMRWQKLSKEGCTLRYLGIPETPERSYTRIMAPDGVTVIAEDIGTYNAYYLAWENTHGKHRLFNIQEMKPLTHRMSEAAQKLDQAQTDVLREIGLDFFTPLCRLEVQRDPSIRGYQFYHWTVGDDSDLSEAFSIGDNSIKHDPDLVLQELNTWHRRLHEPVDGEATGSRGMARTDEVAEPIL